LSVINELKRYLGDVWIDLDEIPESQKRKFFIKLMSSINNRFSEEFISSLYTHTQGHPFFTLEMIQSFQEHHIISKDEDGYWIDSQIINWDNLPPQVEGIIEERISKLEEETHDILSISSVEGYLFNVAIIARIKNMEERQLLRILSQELDKKHQIVQEADTISIGGAWMTRYRFAHKLFQTYLYQQLSQRERMILHSEIAESLEDFYKKTTESNDLLLAYHNDRGGNLEKAAQYYSKAGNRNMKAGAYNVAIDCLQRGIELLEKNEQGDKNSGLLLDTKISLALAIKALRGWGDPDVFCLYNEIVKLNEKNGNSCKISPIIFGLWAYYLAKMNLNTALNYANKCLSPSNKSDDEIHLLQAQIALSNTYFWMGNMKLALQHINGFFKLYDNTKHKHAIDTYGQDPRSLGYMFSILTNQLLGNVSISNRLINELLELLQSFGHSFTEVISLTTLAWFGWHYEEKEFVNKYAEEIINAAKKNGMDLYVSYGYLFKGFYFIKCGDITNGAKYLDDSRKIFEKNHTKLMESVYQLIQYELFLLEQSYEKIIQDVDSWEKRLIQDEELCYLPEFYRYQGIANLKQGNYAEAVNSFKKATDISKKNGTKLFEVKALLQTKYLYIMQENYRGKEYLDSQMSDQSELLDIIKQ